MHDIIIVGSGPAGLTAAVYACRAGKSVLLLEKESFGGQISHSPKVENCPGFPEISGNDFAEKLLDQALGFGAEIDLTRVLEIKDEGKIKTVITDNGSYKCSSVIIAAGSKHRQLGLEGENELVGNGISYCAVCDGAFYQGKKVAVIGGGNSALQDAIMLSERCSHVTMVQNLDVLTGEKSLQDIVNSRENIDILFSCVVESLNGTDSLESIVLKNTKTGETKTLDLDAMFVAIGQMPENEIFENVCSLDERGYILSDEKCITKNDGIFVAGDCRTKAIRQIVTATADGAVAALAACHYIDSL